MEGTLRSGLVLLEAFFDPGDGDVDVLVRLYIGVALVAAFWERVHLLLRSDDLREQLLRVLELRYHVLLACKNQKWV